MEKTISEKIEEIKEEICKNYCKYEWECMNRLENNQDTRPCPLDKL